MMLKITTHNLNGTDGTHAGGVGLALYNRDGAAPLFVGMTDAGGRLIAEIASEAISPSGEIELVIQNGSYWADRGVPRKGPQIVDEIVMRMKLPANAGHHHVPVMLSPNSFSSWWSA